MPPDYEILTAPLDEPHGHTQARAMLNQLDRDGWEIVGDPIVYVAESGPAMCIVIRRERS